MGLTLSGVRGLFWRCHYEKTASDDAVAVDMLCPLCAAVAEDEWWVDEVGRSSLQSPVPSKGVKRFAKSAESA